MDVLTEQYFDRVYEDLSREHVKLLQNLRNGTGDEKPSMKQVAMLASLQMQILKLRNFRKQLDKRD